MLKIENHMGTITVSEEYLANLVGKTVSDCYGVAGMAESGAAQGLRARLRLTEPQDQGVKLKFFGNRLSIDLYIIVTFGVNISAIVKSIVSKVSYTVQEATGIPVAKVNVHVQGVFTE